MEKERLGNEGGLKGGLAKVVDLRQFRAKALKRDMKPISDFVSSRLAFLEPKLQGDGAGFKEELRQHILSLFKDDKSKISGVEYGDKEESRYLTSMIYIFVGKDEPKEDQERKINQIVTWCTLVATSDMEFLQKMRDKLKIDEPLSSGEIENILSMKQGDWASRYIKEVA